MGWFILVLVSVSYLGKMESLLEWGEALHTWCLGAAGIPKRQTRAPIMRSDVLHICHSVYCGGIPSKSSGLAICTIKVRKYNRKFLHSTRGIVFHARLSICLPPTF